MSVMYNNCNTVCWKLASAGGVSALTVTTLDASIHLNESVSQSVEDDCGEAEVL